MESSFLPINPALRDASRLGWMQREDDVLGLLEGATIVGAGLLAAVMATFVDFSLKIPGHSILRVILPVAAGLAMVPRKGAGTAIGGVALLSAFSFRLGGFDGGGPSLGAMTSLTLTGPLLDWTLRKTRGGLSIYLACGLAGLVSNGLAFAVRALSKYSGWEPMTGKPLSVWMPRAAVTYPVCGFLAGFLCGVIWFMSQHSEKSDTSHESPEQDRPL